MKFSAFFLAALAAILQIAHGYTLFGPSFFEPALTFSPMMRRQRALTAPRFFDDTFQQLSPRYEIVNNNLQLQIAMDVPGVKIEDVDVSLEDGGKILTIRGSRRARTDQSSYSSQFSQSFSLDPVVDVDHISAHLVDGVLTISAPKDAKRLEQNIKSIPILDSAPPVLETPKLSSSKSPEAVALEADEETMDLDDEKEVHKVVVEDKMEEGKKEEKNDEAKKEDVKEL